MGRPRALKPLPSWSFACPDWEERLRQGRSLVPELPLDRAEADRAVAIFNRLRLPDVPATPRLKEAAGDWFRDIVRAGFGSVDRNDGERRVAEIFALVPKKNSKTTGGAAIMLTAMLMLARPRAELILAGPTQEVADLAFYQAVGMIGADEDGYLQKRFRVRDHIKAIDDLKTGRRLKIKTFDPKVMTGSKPVIVLIDELHVMGSQAHAAGVLGQVRGGLLANPESLLIIITTQSDKPPAGVFRQELQYARAVRDGRISESRLLPILYEFPEAMQTDEKRPWADPANWPMVNPNLGLSITLDRLKTDWASAREKGEAEIRRWASQHLNVEIGLALHADRWRGADYWQAAAEPDLVSLDEVLARSEVVTVGIDGGGLDDLLGLALLGRCAATSRWLVWAHAWVQRDVLDLRPEIAPRLEDFAAAGELSICDGFGDGAEPADVAALADLVLKVRDAGLLPERYGVGVDPAGVAAIIDALADRDIKPDAEGGPVCAVFQGYRLNGATLGAERKLKNRTLRHGGQALMAWCVGNAKTELRGNAVIVTKQASGKAKIDPLLALFDAAFLMQRNPKARPSVPPLAERVRARGAVQVVAI